MEKELGETKEVFLKRDLSVWFFRHGEWNYKIDTLTEKGKEQARDAAKDLFNQISEGEIVKFYSSPAERTQETARIIEETLKDLNKGKLKVLGIEPRAKKELENAGFTSSYVKTASDLGISSKDLLGYWYENDDPQGIVETPAKVKRRFNSFLTKLKGIISRLPEGPKINIVLVSHGEVVGTYLKEPFKKNGLHFCKWARFDFRKGKIREVKLATSDKESTEVNL